MANITIGRKSTFVKKLTSDGRIVITCRPFKMIRFAKGARTEIRS